MAESMMDQIMAELRRSAREHYPGQGELRNVRIVGHTPKNDHFIYDMVLDFAAGSERLAAKVYRAGKRGAQGARETARTETANLASIYSVFSRKKLAGVPRPIGDFSSLGAVVAEKLNGMPLQSIIMKAALLPGYADRGTLATAAQKAGEWLRTFHRATTDMPAPFDADSLLGELEQVCELCQRQGLEENAIRMILARTRNVLAHPRKTLPASAVLNDFTPLNVLVGEEGVGIADYARMQPRGSSFQDVALFVAAVEALEKYPFCNRAITNQVQELFLQSYGVSAGDMPLLRLLKMKALLAMFAHGRVVKESAMRKKVMWATVMKKFLRQAADRSLAPAA